MLEKKTLQGQSREVREQKALGTGKNKQNKKQKEYIKLYTRAPEKHQLRPHVIWIFKTRMIRLSNFTFQLSLSLLSYNFLWQIQRNLQLRIEEQGKQLKMMFDQQQKTTNSLLNKQNLDITSPDEPTFILEDIDVSILEGSDNNTQFPSKIS